MKILCRIALALLVAIPSMAQLPPSTETLAKYPWLADSSAPSKMAAKSHVPELKESLENIAGAWLRYGVPHKTATHNHYIGAKPTKPDDSARHIILDISIVNRAGTITMMIYEDNGHPRTFEDAKAAGLKPKEKLIISGRDWSLTTPEGTPIDSGKVAEYKTSHTGL